ncbi:hypothetical protein PPERSA_11101 [Pseudocohnilembus persalinus]|uniref:Histidine phosphatase superfamily, clade-1 n=1 Tax=Pseudocohnilembus persalinus TaxID=266149 RepID=A0A0V0QZU3_PSEPJ|nr:hypothetical protein PPERSA_11101 [Pseudocohnilembus persalinus]|eukprot:KRX07552.1 hypothetical protein PPERSA_11101 [Pseudocohnilembus persalinus]
MIEERKNSNQKRFETQLRNYTPNKNGNLTIKDLFKQNEVLNKVIDFKQETVLPELLQQKEGEKLFKVKKFWELWVEIFREEINFCVNSNEKQLEIQNDINQKQQQLNKEIDICSSLETFLSQKIEFIDQIIMVYQMGLDYFPFEQEFQQKVEELKQTKEKFYQFQKQEKIKEQERFKKLEQQKWERQEKQVYQNTLEKQENYQLQQKFNDQQYIQQDKDCFQKKIEDKISFELGEVQDDSSMVNQAFIQEEYDTQKQNKNNEKNDHIINQKMNIEKQDKEQQITSVYNYKDQKQVNNDINYEQNLNSGGKMIDEKEDEKQNSILTQLDEIENLKSNIPNSEKEEIFTQQKIQEDEEKMGKKDTFGDEFNTRKRTKIDFENNRKLSDKQEIYNEVNNVLNTNNKKQVQKQADIENNSQTPVRNRRNSDDLTIEESQQQKSQLSQKSGSIYTFSIGNASKSFKKKNQNAEQILSIKRISARIQEQRSKSQNKQNINNNSLLLQENNLDLSFQNKSNTKNYLQNQNKRESQVQNQISQQKKSVIFKEDQENINNNDQKNFNKKNNYQFKQSNKNESNNLCQNLNSYFMENGENNSQLRNSSKISGLFIGQQQLQSSQKKKNSRLNLSRTPEINNRSIISIDDIEKALEEDKLVYLNNNCQDIDLDCVDGDEELKSFISTNILPKMSQSQKKQRPQKLSVNIQGKINADKNQNQEQEQNLNLNLELDLQKINREKLSENKGNKRNRINEFDNDQLQFNSDKMQEEIIQMNSQEEQKQNQIYNKIEQQGFNSCQNENNQELSVQNDQNTDFVQNLPPKNEVKIDQNSNQLQSQEQKVRNELVISEEKSDSYSYKSQDIEIEKIVDFNVNENNNYAVFDISTKSVRKAKLEDKRVFTPLKSQQSSYQERFQIQSGKMKQLVKLKELIVNPEMAEIYVIRHAESEDNVILHQNMSNYKTQEINEPALTKRGELQAESLFQHFQEKNIKPDFIFTSPHLRTVQTANIQNDDLYQDQQKEQEVEEKILSIISPELSEVSKTYHKGEVFKGLNSDFFQENFPDFSIVEGQINQQGWNFDKEPENLKKAAERAKNYLTYLKEQVEEIYMRTQKKQVIFLFTHAFFIDLLLGEIIGRKIESQNVFPIGNTGVTKLGLNEKGMYFIQQMNDMVHLQDFFVQKYLNENQKQRIQLVGGLLQNYNLINKNNSENGQTNEIQNKDHQK